MSAQVAEVAEVAAKECDEESLKRLASSGDQALAEAKLAKDDRVEELCDKDAESQVSDVVRDMVEQVAESAQGDDGAGTGLKDESIMPAEEDLDEDDDDELITFEGVKYIYDEESSEVYTHPDMDLVGTWDGGAIDWEHDVWKAKHEELKN